MFPSEIQMKSLHLKSIGNFFATAPRFHLKIQLNYFSFFSDEQQERELKKHFVKINFPEKQTHCILPTKNASQLNGSQFVADFRYFQPFRIKPFACFRRSWLFVFHPSTPLGTQKNYNKLNWNSFFIRAALLFSWIISEIQSEPKLPLSLHFKDERFSRFSFILFTLN